MHEAPGGETNPRIADYYRSTTLGGPLEDSTTPWCSAFANWVMEHAGYRGTRRANARSWLSWGEPLALDAPKIGAITVLWRDTPDSGKGHVAFYLGKLGKSVWLLGGNQGNAVSPALYSESRILGFRWPTEADRKA